MSFGTVRVARAGLLVLGAHVAACGWVGLELVEPVTSPVDAGDMLDASLLDAGTADAATDAALACADACSCAALLPAPSHRFTFDETSGSSARDVVGGAVATLSNFTGAYFQPAVLANGLSFDGVDDLASVGVLDGAPRTLAFYLRADSTSVSVSQTAAVPPTSTGNPRGDWATPENAYARDNRTTTFSGSGAGQAQDYAGFDFALPAGAQVRGLEVTTTSQNTLAITPTFGVALSWDGGATYTAQKNGPILFSGDFKLGGAADTWGHAFTAAELGTPFRVRLISANVSLFTLSQGVDALVARAYFAPIGAPRVVLALAPDVRVELGDAGLSLVGFPAGSTLYVDGAPGSALAAGTGFHHVVVVSPAAISASAVSFGGPASNGGMLDGTLDDLRVYDAALSASDVRTLYAAGSCGP